MLFYLSNLFLISFPQENFHSNSQRGVNLLLYIPNRASARDGDGAQQVVRCSCSYHCSSQHLVRSQQQCNNVDNQKDPDVMHLARSYHLLHLLPGCSVLVHQHMRTVAPVQVPVFQPMDFIVFVNVCAELLPLPPLFIYQLSAGGVLLYYCYSLCHLVPF